jgi:hypothetical protein
VSSILLSALFGAPWLVAIVVTWSSVRRIDAVAPSVADSVRRRLWGA